MWSLQGLTGTVSAGTLTVAGQPLEQAGLIKATSGALTGEARARVVHPLPWTETFESYADARRAAWLGQRGGRQVFGGDARWAEGAAEGAGQHHLQAGAHVHRTDGSCPTTRSRPMSASNTKRRQMADIGITAQRYSLVLYGNNRKS